MQDPLKTLAIFGIPLGWLITLGTLLYQRRKFLGSVQHELGLEPFTAYVKNGLRYRLGRRLRPSLASTLSLREYSINRLSASKKKNVLTVPAAVPKELKLDDMFVPLSVLSTGGDRLSGSQIARGEHERVLLVGDPGSGKSTLVRRIYRDNCRTGVTSRLVALCAILLDLKDLTLPEDRSELADNWLFERVQREVTEVGTYAADNLWRSFLEAGRLLVLLDGLDEVRTEDLPSVNSQILSLSDRLAKANRYNRLVVTTRRQLYNHLGEEFTSPFDALFLEQFTSGDIYEFLRRWPYDRPRDHEVARIFENLSEQPNIREMCATPLVLAMYVATDQLSSGVDLPETRPEFYRAVTDELLVRRRGRQLGMTAGLTTLRRERQRVIGRIALDHLLDGRYSRNALDWDRAVEIVCEELSLEPDSGATKLLELSRDTGLFTVERHEESLTFMHLTFCEFLAAQRVVQAGSENWSMVRERVEGLTQMPADRAIERLAEVVIFASALEEKDAVRRERLRWVMRTCEPELALRTIRDSQAYDEPDTLAWVEDVANRIRRTGADATNEQWLRLFRQIAVVLRDSELVAQAQADSKPELLSDFLAGVVEGSQEAFTDLFTAYARIDAAGAMRMTEALDIDATEVIPRLLIRSMDEPVILAHAVSELTSSEAGGRRWAWLLALAARSDPSVASRLKHSELSTSGGLDGIPPRPSRGWVTNYLFGHTLLGHVFDIAWTSPGPSVSMRVASQVRPRRRRLVDGLGRIRVARWMVLVAALVVVHASTRLTGISVAPIFWVSVYSLWLLSVIFTVVWAARGGSWSALPPYVLLRGTSGDPLVLGSAEKDFLKELLVAPRVRWAQVCRYRRRAARELLQEKDLPTGLRLRFRLNVWLYPWYWVGRWSPDATSFMAAGASGALLQLEVGASSNLRAGYGVAVTDADVDALPERRYGDDRSLEAPDLAVAEAG